MKRSNGNPWLLGALLVAVMIFGGIPTFANAAEYVNDFNSDIGAASLFGDAVLDNGSVRLTDSINSQTGSLIIDDLTPQYAISSFTATFDLLTGPGSDPPADGISFTVGRQPDFAVGEEGLWRLLTISFDTFDNGDPDHIGIDLRFHNNNLATSLTNPFTDGVFVPVTVEFRSDGTLDLTFDGNPIFTNVQTGYTPKIGDRFGFGGRTGASNEVQRIDNVGIMVIPLVNVVPALGRYGLAILALSILGIGFIGFRRLV